MSDGTITRYKPDPTKPHKTDWTEADKLTDDEIHAAALSDPDAQPKTLEQLSRARRVVDVRLIRERLGLSQEQFARQFGLPAELVREWEDGTSKPDRAAVVLLRVIAAEPAAVERALAVAK